MHHERPFPNLCLSILSFPPPTHRRGMKSLCLTFGALAFATPSTLATPQGTDGCGFNLLSCQVSDPTRKEAPWAGSTKVFPQCYDPARYIYASNFLCPVGRPKMPGQYACGLETAYSPIGPVSSPRQCSGSWRRRWHKGLQLHR